MHKIESISLCVLFGIAVAMFNQRGQFGISFCLGLDSGDQKNLQQDKMDCNSGEGELRREAT